MSSPQKVVFIQDAAIDEYMAQILLQRMEGIELAAIVIVNADCLPGAGTEAAWRIQKYIEKPDVPLGLSAARGWNGFPWSYRADCVKENELRVLADIPLPQWPPYPDGDAVLEQALSGSEVTVLATGPVTPLVNLLRARPELAKNVSRLIVMGGAIHVNGNLAKGMDAGEIPEQAWNAYAEWNIFWDTQSVDWIFRNTDFPICLFPLDITDQAKLKPEFLGALKSQGKTSSLSRLASDSYAIVSAEVFYEMWDVATAAFLARPDLYAPPAQMKLEVEVSGPNEGRLQASPGGRKVDVYLNFADQDGFYEFVLNSFK